MQHCCQSIWRLLTLKFLDKVRNKFLLVVQISKRVERDKSWFAIMAGCDLRTSLRNTLCKWRIGKNRKFSVCYTNAIFTLHITQGTYCLQFCTVVNPSTEIRQDEEWTELRDVNEKTRTYENRPNFRDLNKILECQALFVWEA